MQLRVLRYTLLSLLLAALTAQAGEHGAADDDLLTLVGPVALYPDDLLAIVLPAATRPVQVVQAARYLKERATQPGLRPDPAWDPSVVALLNYPEVLARLAADPGWTTELGVAVAESEDAVLAAVTRFRQQARRAGNLSSDRHQVVETSGTVVTIRPADPTLLYVPDYQPGTVLIHQPSFVYRYFARPFPVYYYPYPLGHSMTHRDYFGVSSLYRIAWQDRKLRLLLHQHRAHPYYGRAYAWQYGFNRLHRDYPFPPGAGEPWWTYPSSARHYHSAEGTSGSMVLRPRPVPDALAPRGERILLHRGSRTGHPGQPAAARQMPRYP